MVLSSQNLLPVDREDVYTSAFILVQLVEEERRKAFKMLLHRKVGGSYGSASGSVQTS